MSCCGKGREALKAQRHSITHEVDTEPSPERIRYTGDWSILIRGPISGRAYSFDTERREQPVDERDTEAMLLTGMFERSGGRPSNQQHG